MLLLVKMRRYIKVNDIIQKSADHFTNIHFHRQRNLHLQISSGCNRYRAIYSVFISFSSVLGLYPNTIQKIYVPVKTGIHHQNLLCKI